MCTTADEKLWFSNGDHLQLEAIKSLVTRVLQVGFTIAKSAAEIANVKLVFKTGSVEIYDQNGKLIETITENNGKLAYTGNNVNIVLVVSVIATIALAITVVAKKKIVDAK